MPNENYGFIDKTLLISYNLCIFIRAAALAGMVPTGLLQWIARAARMICAAMKPVILRVQQDFVSYNR